MEEKKEMGGSGSFDYFMEKFWNRHPEWKYQGVKVEKKPDHKMEAANDEWDAIETE